jgi:hypothetical protein
MSCELTFNSFVVEEKPQIYLGSTIYPSTSSSSLLKSISSVLRDGFVHTPRISSFIPYNVYVALAEGDSDIEMIREARVLGSFSSLVLFNCTGIVFLSSI